MPRMVGARIRNNGWLKGRIGATPCCVVFRELWGDGNMGGYPPQSTYRLGGGPVPPDSCIPDAT